MAKTDKYFWVKKQDDGTTKIGISATGVDELGQINFIDLPDSGTTLTVDGEFISVEAEKAVTDIPSPVAGKVVTVNPDLSSSTDSLNSENEEDRWIMIVK